MDHLVMNFHLSIIVASYSSMKSQDVEKMKFFEFFFEKQLLTGKLSEFCSGSFHRDTNRRAVFKFCEIWLTGNQ